MGKRSGFLMIEDLVVIAVLGIAVLGVISLIFSVTRSYMKLDPISLMKYKDTLDRFEKTITIAQKFYGTSNGFSRDELGRMLGDYNNAFSLDNDELTLNLNSRLVKRVGLYNSEGNRVVYGLVIDNEEDLEALLGAEYLELPGVDLNGDGVPDKDSPYSYKIVVLPDVCVDGKCGMKYDVDLSSNSDKEVKLDAGDVGAFGVSRKCKELLGVQADLYLLRQGKKEENPVPGSDLFISPGDVLAYRRTSLPVLKDAGKDVCGSNVSFEKFLKDFVKSVGPLENTDKVTEVFIYSHSR